MPSTDAQAGITTAPIELYRKDYKALPIDVAAFHLDFNLNEITCVRAKIEICLTKDGKLEDLQKNGLFLNGRKDILLKSVKQNGVVLTEGKDFTLESHGLTLHGATIVEAFKNQATVCLETEVHIRPKENTLLEGLYQSSGNFCTQCEAEGFRGITYFFDRPDILTRFTTRLEACKIACPVLLSNGNLVASGDLDNGRHFATWVDPFLKPSYLFALVGGNLLHKEDSFVTMTGGKVCLRIFVQESNIGRVDHAMQSLKKAMKWDEDTFGREYDLEQFNIVAVDDFNMGAMENKSLNIFNSRAVLATSETATDMDFQRIEGIVAHEYFHNWTGNRVTCRDWFQLTLKEGLTVYRDQEFSSDMNSRAVYRLGVVAMVRSLQFPQDSGPMAHCIRPESYQKIDNFYTITVYRKGAEIIRLYETILGKKGFRKGTDLYFERHDGQAVTCDDFLKAMEDANAVDLSALHRWYSQAGTPQVNIKTHFDVTSKTYTIQATQHTAPTPGQPTKIPVLIPIRISLLDSATGKPMAISLKGTTEKSIELVLPLKDQTETFILEGIQAEACVLSAMRSFSAPVQYNIEGESPQTWTFLLQHDTDGFVRFESSQRLYQHCIAQIYNALLPIITSEQQVEIVSKTVVTMVAKDLVKAYESILQDTSIDQHLKSHLLSSPSNSELMLQLPQCDPCALHRARKELKKYIVTELRDIFLRLLTDLEASKPTKYQYTPDDVGRRALINTCYAFLTSLPSEDANASQIESKLLDLQKKATNMTEEIGAANALNCSSVSAAARSQSLQMFREKWENEPLVLLKWLTLHSMAEVPNNIVTVQAIMQSSAFNLCNPNSVYSLVGAFTSSLLNFHAADGSGYTFIADAVVKIDQVNHQVAAKTVACFDIHKQLDSARQKLILAELSRIAAVETLSPNVREIVEKSLKQ